MTNISEVVTASIIRAMIGLMEAVNICETSVNFYKTTV
jgi:hypothetical protein